MSKIILHHYTSMQSLFKILEGVENEKITFRATHYKYLNDKTECELFESYFRIFIKDKPDIEKVINECPSKKQDPYIISFSEKEDDLTMYRHYGNGKGVCLSFEFEVNEFGWIQNCEYVSTQQQFNSLMYGDISYVPISIDSMDNIDEWAVSYNYSPNLIYRIKHMCFIDEAEMRLILMKEDGEVESFYERDGLIIPFLKYQIPVNTLCKIWLAPGCNQELSELSIQKMLQSKKISNVKIHPSLHPYVCG